MSEDEFKQALRFILVAAVAIAAIMVLFYAGKEVGCGAILPPVR